MNGKGKYTMLERSILMFFLLFGNLPFNGIAQEEIGIINAPLQLEDSIRLKELEKQLKLFFVTGESQDSILLVLRKYKQIAFKSRCVKPITTYYKMKGYSFHYSSAFDSAMWCYKKGVEISEKLNYRYGIVKCNASLAICEYIKGNYNRAIGLDLENLEYFKENLDYTNMAITCGNLGISYSDFQLPDKALMYELLALKYAEWGYDSLIIASIYDQLGRIYTSLRDYNKANYYLTLGEKMSLKTNNRSSLAGVYYSFANLYSAKGDYNKAIELNGKAMLLFEDMEEFFEQALCYLQLASVELRLNHRQAAFKNILKSEELSISIKDSITLMNTYKLKYEYFKKYGDEKSALKAFEDYSYIKDIFYMINNKRNYGSYVLEGEMKARTQKLVEKNLRNELEIVKSEKEIGMAAAKVKRLYFTVALTFLSMLLIIIIFLFIFKSKRNRLVRDHLMEMVQVQENERNRISKYLHDNVGHYLVLLRSELRDKKMIDEVIQQIRYISLNLYPFLIAKVGLKNALVELVDKSFKKETYFYSYYISDDIDAVQKDKAVDLYRIMQELFSNIIKHAGASEINIEIVKEARYYCVKVSDNGRGFNYQQERTKNTLGLTSIIERVRSLKGSIDFQSGKEGTQVSIRF